MIEPKDKAKELVEKFDPCASRGIDDTSEIGLESSKEIAIICVDEIISACEYNHVESYNTDWWNKVREAITEM